MQPSIASVVGLKGREVGEAPLALVPTKKKLTLMRHAASVDLGSSRALAATGSNDCFGLAPVTRQRFGNRQLGSDKPDLCACGYC